MTYTDEQYIAVAMEEISRLLFGPDYMDETRDSIAEISSGIDALTKQRDALLVRAERAEKGWDAEIAHKEEAIRLAYTRGVADGKAGAEKVLGKIR